MDLQLAYLHRARAALDMAAADAGPSVQTRAAAFTEAAFVLMRTKDLNSALPVLQAHRNPMVSDVAKAAGHMLGDWEGDAATLAASYIASIAEDSLLDRIMRYARVLPIGLGSILIASGATAGTVDEGAPKAVKHLVLNQEAESAAIKAAAIVVLSKELMGATGATGMRLFEQELRSAVTRAINAAVLTNLLSTSVEVVTGTGDALVDLRAGLKAAGPSTGYVVAVPTAAAVDLATRTENRSGMGVRGGEFVPGVEVVAVDGQTTMTVIPASALAVHDFGLKVRGAGHASVDMADSPSSPAEQVSLWQTNSYGLLAERGFLFAGDPQIATVTGS